MTVAQKIPWLVFIILDCTLVAVTHAPHKKNTSIKSKSIFISLYIFKVSPLLNKKEGLFILLNNLFGGPKKT